MPDKVIASLIGLGVALVVSVLVHLAWGRRQLAKAKSDAQHINEKAILESQAKAKDIELKARDEQIKAKEAVDRETETTRRELRELEQRLGKREDTLDRKLDTLGVKERNLELGEKKLAQREKAITTKEEETDAALAEQKKRLLEIASLTPDQAKELMLRRVEEECREEAGKIVRKSVEQATEEAKDKSREVILQAIQRYASEQTSDHTVSTVDITSDDMKGRVIGREGRNIRSFEKVTGVDVIIDDTPGVVILSCFDPVRRETARRTLDRLVQDGRIHPARIEEVYASVCKEMDDEIFRMGKEACQEVNLPNIPKGLLPTIGRLGFRTSYGQNVLRHSIEVAYISQMIAEQLGLDGQIARRCGFLHDIGKALDHEQEGGHPEIGRNALRKFGESEIVQNAAEAHHGDKPAISPYTPIVTAADAVSAARPGARRESVERYVKRLQDLEDLATGFDGVQQAYAIQAGRELRVILDAKKVSDNEAAKIARDLAQKIQDTMTYPGEVRVTVIREVRSVDYAK